MSPDVKAMIADAERAYWSAHAAVGSRTLFECMRAALASVGVQLEDLAAMKAARREAGGRE